MPAPAAGRAGGTEADGVVAVEDGVVSEVHLLFAAFAEEALDHIAARHEGGGNTYPLPPCPPPGGFAGEDRFARRRGCARGGGPPTNNRSGIGFASVVLWLSPIPGPSQRSFRSRRQVGGVAILRVEGEDPGGR